jgi:hypothetical protein
MNIYRGVRRRGRQSPAETVGTGPRGWHNLDNDIRSVTATNGKRILGRPWSRLGGILYRVREAAESPPVPVPRKGKPNPSLLPLFVWPSHYSLVDWTRVQQSKGTTRPQTHQSSDIRTKPNSSAAFPWAGPTTTTLEMPAGAEDPGSLELWGYLVFSFNKIHKTKHMPQGLIDVEDNNARLRKEK